jgi:hypothetical protein
VKSKTNKRRQGEHFTPMQIFYRNKGLPSHIIFEIVEEDFPCFINSHDESIIVQDQEIIEHVATKVVNIIADLVAKHVVLKSTKEKLHQDNQNHQLYQDIQDNPKLPTFLRNTKF